MRPSRYLKRTDKFWLGPIPMFRTAGSCCSPNHPQSGIVDAQILGISIIWFVGKDWDMDQVCALQTSNEVAWTMLWFRQIDRCQQFFRSTGASFANPLPLVIIPQCFVGADLLGVIMLISISFVWTEIRSYANWFSFSIGHVVVSFFFFFESVSSSFSLLPSLFLLFIILFIVLVQSLL